MNEKPYKSEEEVVAEHQKEVREGDTRKNAGDLYNEQASLERDVEEVLKSKTNSTMSSLFLETIESQEELDHVLNTIREAYKQDPFVHIEYQIGWEYQEDEGGAK